MKDEIVIKLSAFEVEFLLNVIKEFDKLPVVADIHDKLHPPLYEFTRALEDAKEV